MARLQHVDSFRHCTDKRIGHNTRLTRNGAGFSLRYHHTDVVSVSDSIELTPIETHIRTLTVNTGGWRTVTTLQRIRHALEALGLELWTHDIPGEWRVVHRRRGQAFTMRGSVLKLRQVDGGEWQRIA